jgi:hypothetical protein
MPFHQKLRRFLRQSCLLLPSGGQLVTLRWRGGLFFRLTVAPPLATYVFDLMARRYFDRLHPLSDIFYERAP